MTRRLLPLLTWQIGKLQEGASGTLTITAIISDTGYFTNTVWITNPARDGLVG